MLLLDQAISEIYRSAPCSFTFAQPLHCLHDDLAKAKAGNPLLLAIGYENLRSPLISGLIEHLTTHVDQAQQLAMWNKSACELLVFKAWVNVIVVHPTLLLQYCTVFASTCWTQDLWLLGVCQ